MTAFGFVDDLESQPACSRESCTKKSSLKPEGFSYDPTTFWQRLLVSVRLKNNLDTSKIIQVEYNVAYKYCLIIALLLIAALLTPQLLPKWVGFEWASPQDLCQSSASKLQVVDQQLRNFTRIDDANRYLEMQKHTLKCMNDTAAMFYHGKEKTPPRFLWPNECDSQKASVSLNETTCIKKQTTNACTFNGQLFGSFFGSGSCVQDTSPEVCTTTTNKERNNALLELERNRAAAHGVKSNLTESPILATANSKVQEIISRIITQVDIASDAFILYSLISIAVGVPLIIYRRERGSRIVTATFGLTKVWFIVVFIVIASVYDSASVIFKQTDFPRLFSNFLKDPCYVDPHFSSQRVGKIMDLCNNVSRIDAESNIVLQRMDAIYYDTRLFGFCKDAARELAVHPKLAEMDRIRKAYRTNEIFNPGRCNSTDLNQRTAAAPETQEKSTWKALLGSGVVAQLALKFILTSWILHAVAYVEPMVLHNGKVEVWGAKRNLKLSEEEKDAIKRFARDKHLLAVLLFSALMIFEVFLVIYSISTTISGGGQIPLNSLNETQAIQVKRACPTSLALALAS